MASYYFQKIKMYGWKYWKKILITQWWLIERFKTISVAVTRQKEKKCESKRKMLTKYKFIRKINK